MVGFFILGMLAWGMAIGWIGELLLGRAKPGKTNWGQALVAGAAGSLIAGSVGSFIAGEGFQFRPAGIIASVIGAVIVVVVWNAIAPRKER